MSPQHSGKGTTTVALVIVILILAASLGAYYLSTSPVLTSQGQSISSLQSPVSSLVSNPETSTITTAVLSTATTTQLLTVTATQLSTTTAVRTQTVVTRTNYTITNTASETETSTTTVTIANRTIPWDGLVYLSAQPGCSVSSGSTSYPAPCSSFSDPYVFNCAAAAATPQGSTEQVNITGTTNESYTVTVWYPFNSGQPAINCYWTQILPGQPEFEQINAYCIPVNSTSFLVSESAPPLV